MSTKKNKEFSKSSFLMNLAYLQARKSLGNTGINPPVGCVIISKEDELITLGRTGKNGIPHAEINAIKSYKKKLKNSNLYVTIEPCTHYGRTPPCVNSIIKKNIKKVFYSIDDIDRRTAKKSSYILKKNKIYVYKGLFKNKIKKFYNFYIKNKNNKLPYVTCKVAVSKDGYIKNILKKNITNEYSKKTSHLLRSQNNAIIISSKTLISDNPLLNCRVKGLENLSPIRIILDKNLDIPIKSKITNTSKNIKTFVFYNKINKAKEKILKKKNVKLFIMPLNKNNRFEIKDLLIFLYKQKISKILVEGGKQLTKSFLDSGLVDELYVFKSDTCIKSNGRIQITKTLNKSADIFRYKKKIITNLNGDNLYNYTN